MIWIGIDTGTNTGIAIWDSSARRFVALDTLPIHKAIFLVEDYASSERAEGRSIHVVFEDARQRKPEKGMTKWSPEHFATMTGYTKRCSNHARDAALLVWGR